MVLKELPLSLFSKKVIKSILGFAILAFLASLWHRYAIIDDCWFGEQAYWLAKLGYVKTESIQVGLGWEERLFVYHKLNIWIGALIVNYLGWSIYYFKTFTLIVYFSFFFFLSGYFQSDKKNFTNYHFLLASLLIFANPLMFIYGFSYRPEILVMFFGFISFLSLEKGRTNELKQLLFAMFAGSASGLAFLSHMNGLIFGVSGFIYLLVFRKYKMLAVFALSSLVFSSTFFIDLLPAGNFESFLQQLRHWPDAVSGNYLSGNSLLINALIKLASEHQRFFWSDKVAVFSVIFFLSAIFSFRYLKDNYRPLLIYTGLLILFLNLLGSHIAERYIIYYLPMMAIINAISVLHMINSKQHGKLSFIALLMVVQMGILSKHWVEIIKENSYFQAINHELAGFIPEGNHKVLAPYHYIYNEIGRNPLLTYHTLEYYQVLTKKVLTGNEASTRCKELGVEYIIVGKELNKDGDVYRWFGAAMRGLDANYGVFREHKGFLILSAVKPQQPKAP